MLKKIALALSAVGFSSLALAGHPGDAVVAPAGVNLIAPDSVGVWSVGLEALYMEPSNSEFQYAQISNGASPVTSLTNKTVDNEHDWGGTIDIAYMFPGNSRDVKLSYTHLDMDDSSNASTVGTTSTIENPFTGSTSYNAAKGSSDYDYNAVDLVFGQWIKIGERVDLHPFGGLRYAGLDQTDKGYYTVSTDAGSYADGKITSDWDGIGPRGGIDGVVHVGSGVSIVGTIAGSLLVGSTDSKFYSNVYTSSALSDGDYIKNSDDTHVIPELDARLGINYTYSFNPETALGVELGYQTVNYFNVSDKDFIDASTPNTINNSEDFGYHGPYLRLQLSMA